MDRNSFMRWAPPTSQGDNLLLTLATEGDRAVRIVCAAAWATVLGRGTWAGGTLEATATGAMSNGDSSFFIHDESSRHGC